MPSTKEIRGKIKSVQNTRKITKAMEMVAASKMRKAQDRMFAARPYGEKIRVICAHLAKANSEYKHPFLVKHEGAKKVGIIVVTTDKGLAGPLNTNIQRHVLHKMKTWAEEGVAVQATAIGTKGLNFLNHLNVPVESQVVQLGDQPNLDRLIGAIKVQIDAFIEGKVDSVHLAYSRFVNAMKQQPVIEQILPLSGELLELDEPERQHSWTTSTYLMPRPFSMIS